MTTLSLSQLERSSTVKLRGPDAPPLAPPHAHAAGVMLDSHGRAIRDLRISITDRCNFRCVYCMDPDVRFMPKDELLTIDEIARLARITSELGVRKIRLTGGEPTLHPQLGEIIAAVSAASDAEIALTTNGATLTEESLIAWRHAGLDRITISIDAVEPDAFDRVTRSHVGADRVLAGIEAAIRAGLQPVKLNAVLIRGVNEDQVVPLTTLARSYGVEMRFIEFMPLDSGRRWDRACVVPADEIIQRIGEAFELVALGRDDPSSTSETFEFADGAAGSVGVIAPVTRPFCGACSRLRITADARVRPCLFSTVEWDLRPLLRNGGSESDIRRFLVDATWTKQAGHGIDSRTFLRPERSMSAIGG